MKPLKLIQDPTYQIIRYSDSTWLKAEHKQEMIGMCFDEESAYQLIYQHIHNNGGKCERLSKSDFKTFRKCES